MTVNVSVIGIGLLGPGFADWTGGRALLRDPSAWSITPTAVPAPQRLPATERRRAGTVVKASIVVADQALTMADAKAAHTATVFTSSTGDPLNCHQLCEALATPERMVSPTKFTNSVHNAAAGYWHIAAASRAPSTSLAAFDASFGAGLLEAAVQCAAAAQPVLLVAADVPYPEPLHAKRPLPDSFAVALLLAPAGSGRSLSVALGDAASPTRCTDRRLDTLRAAIPAARALPLLQALAHDTAASVAIDGAPGQALSIHLGAVA